MDARPSDAGHREINQVSNTKVSFNLSVFVFGDLQNIHFVDKKKSKSISDLNVGTTWSEFSAHQHVKH